MSSCRATNAKKAELEHDLEVWRQAYNAALSGYDVAEVLSGFEHSRYIVASSPKELADRALADYRAMREEMGI